MTSSKPVILDDETIKSLLKEPKGIPSNYEDWLKTRKLRKQKKRLRRRNVTGDNGSRFTITIQEEIQHDNKFSVILGYRKLRLVKLNGFHGPHSNILEKPNAGWQIDENQPHIHYCTERYQQWKIDKHDSYAEATDDFRDLHSAVGYFVNEFGFYFTDGDYRTPLPLLDGIL